MRRIKIEIFYSEVFIARAFLLPYFIVRKLNNMKNMLLASSVITVSKARSRRSMSNVYNRCIIWSRSLWSSRNCFTRSQAGLTIVVTCPQCKRPLPKYSPPLARSRIHVTARTAAVFGSTFRASYARLERGQSIRRSILALKPIGQEVNRSARGRIMHYARPCSIS